MAREPLFVNDPIGPADRDTWTVELQKVKTSLGLTHNVPFTVDLFLPALNSAEVTYRAPWVSDDCEVETDLRVTSTGRR